MKEKDIIDEIIEMNTNQKNLVTVVLMLVASLFFIIGNLTESGIYYLGWVVVLFQAIWIVMLIMAANRKNNQ